VSGAPTRIERLRAWARALKRDGVTLWFALRHAGTPIWVKAVAALVVAYALSPIDLIPDFIPVLGWLDDLILLPGLIWLALRGLPSEVRNACRVKADAWLASGAAKPRSWVGWFGAALVVLLWALMLWWGWRAWDDAVPR
jgi:uncharacterized membrane protein YkvA (DUF1232 family)